MSAPKTTTGRENRREVPEEKIPTKPRTKAPRGEDKAPPQGTDDSPGPTPRQQPWTPAYGRLKGRRRLSLRSIRWH